MKLTCHRHGDYLLPILGQDEYDKQSIGKHGMPRTPVQRKWLQANQSVYRNYG